MTAVNPPHSRGMSIARWDPLPAPKISATTGHPSAANTASGSRWWGSGTPHHAQTWPTTSGSASRVGTVDSRAPGHPRAPTEPSRGGGAPMARCVLRSRGLRRGPELEVITATSHASPPEPLRSVLRQLEELELSCCRRRSACRSRQRPKFAGVCADDSAPEVPCSKSTTRDVDLRGCLRVSPPSQGRRQAKLLFLFHARSRR